MLELLLANSLSDLSYQSTYWYLWWIILAFQIYLVLSFKRFNTKYFVKSKIVVVSLFCFILSLFVIYLPEQYPILAEIHIALAMVSMIIILNWLLYTCLKLNQTGLLSSNKLKTLLIFLISLGCLWIFFGKINVILELYLGLGLLYFLKSLVY